MGDSKRKEGREGDIFGGISGCWQWHAFVFLPVMSLVPMLFQGYCPLMASVAPSFYPIISGLHIPMSQISQNSQTIHCGLHKENHQTSLLHSVPLPQIQIQKKRKLASIDHFVYYGAHVSVLSNLRSGSDLSSSISSILIYDIFYIKSKIRKTDL